MEGIPLRTTTFGLAAALAVVCLANLDGHGQTTRRVNVGPNGEQAQNESLRWQDSVSVSASGEVVAFASAATNLVPGDTNGVHDVFVYYRRTGLVSRVSVGTSGVEGDQRSGAPSVSANGRFVAFDSIAGNLVPNGGKYGQDIFVRDLELGVTSLVSASLGGGPANGLSGHASISAEGRFVAFSSLASDLVAGDVNGVQDIFVCDTQTGLCELVSVDSDERQIPWPYHATSPSISANGRFVAFSSRAPTLVSGDLNGVEDVFVRDRVLGVTVRASVSSAGGEADRPCYTPSISGDGRYVSFCSSAKTLAPGFLNDLDDVFVRDLLSGTTMGISLSSSGQEGVSLCASPSVSYDSGYVSFVSRSRLVPEDTNGSDDVYVWDRLRADLSIASVDSMGRLANSSSSAPAISADGRFVSFVSGADNLVENDSNNRSDVFLRDRVFLSVPFLPRGGATFNYEVRNALGESGNPALVLLSCSGTGGFPVPGTRDEVPLTLDACTLTGLRLLVVLSGVVDALGVSQTPSVSFPSIAPGFTFYSAAVTIDVHGGTVRSVTGPIQLVVQ